MTTAVQRRRGTATEHSSFTGLEGELSVNTTNESVHVHDGSTAGGFELARADASNIVATSIDINGGTIDGTTIGASSASTGAFTTLTASGAFTSVGIDDNATSTAITIDSSENVGIGTTAIMQDFGDGRTTLALKGTGTADYSTLQLGNYGTSSNGQIHGLVNFYDGTTSVSRIQSVRASNTSDAHLAFYTAPSSGGITERARLTSDGNLGIGTSSPDTLLELVGADPILTVRDSGTSSGTANATIRLAESGASDSLDAYWDIKAVGGQLQFIDNWNEGGGTGTRVVIDDGGNVGIGRTPRVALDVAGEVAIPFDTTYGLRFYNQPQNNWSSIGCTETSSAANLVFKDSTGEVMRMTSGNVAIGTTYADEALEVSGDVKSSGGSFGIYHFGETSDVTKIVGRDGGHGSFPNTMDFFTNSAQRMRIDSSGNLLVGCTALPSGGAGGAGFETGQSGGRTILQLGTTVTSSEAVARFYNPNGAIGSISLSGSSTAYNTSSDQRLKENIADADDAGSKIDAIQVRKFDWKADGSHQDYGMIAQELQAVAPEAVSGDADSEEMMGVDYSKLVPMLIKEIQ